MEGEGLFMAPRILLFIQGVKGGGQELHLARPPGIALGNKEKAKAERPHLLTGAGYCQEVKLPLLLQKKTYCEITELSQSQTVLSSSGRTCKRDVQTHRAGYKVENMAFTHNSAQRHCTLETKGLDGLFVHPWMVRSERP